MAHAPIPHFVLDFMKRSGGSFAARLAGLYLVCDQPNRDRLVDTFRTDFQTWTVAANVGAPPLD